jgi:hypothetical protein
VLQVEVGPAAQFGQSMFGKEFRRAAVAGQIPGGGLGAIFAEFGGIGFLRYRAFLLLLANDAGRAGQMTACRNTRRRLQLFR